MSVLGYVLHILYYHLICPLILRYNGEVGDVVVGRITEVRKRLIFVSKYWEG